MRLTGSSRISFIGCIISNGHGQPASNLHHAVIKFIEFKPNSVFSFIACDHIGRSFIQMCFVHFIEKFRVSSCR